MSKKKRVSSTKHLYKPNRKENRRKKKKKSTQKKRLHTHSFFLPEKFVVFARKKMSPKPISASSTRPDRTPNRRTSQAALTSTPFFSLVFWFFIPLFFFVCVLYFYYFYFFLFFIYLFYFFLFIFASVFFYLRFVFLYFFICWKYWLFLYNQKKLRTFCIFSFV